MSDALVDGITGAIVRSHSSAARSYTHRSPAPAVSSVQDARLVRLLRPGTLKLSLSLALYLLLMDSAPIAGSSALLTLTIRPGPCHRADAIADGEVGTAAENAVDLKSWLELIKLSDYHEYARFGPPGAFHAVLPSARPHFNSWHTTLKVSCLGCHHSPA